MTKSPTFYRRLAACIRAIRVAQYLIIAVFRRHCESPNRGTVKPLKYAEPLKYGTLIRRYKRFFADIETADGESLTIHCPNTGSMKNCQVAGSRCWYSLTNNPKRKLPGTLERVTTHFGNLAGVNTGLPNKLVREAIEENRIEQFAGFTELRSEVRYGEENSRIDLLLQGRQGACYVEVKSVTLDMGDGLALFPDAVTSRGTKHLRELMAMAAAGHRAALFFCVQLSAAERVAIAEDIDPEYAKTLDLAMRSGVEVMAWQCEFMPHSSRLLRPLPMAL